MSQQSFTPSQKPDLFSRLRAKHAAMYEPMHLAAVGYLATRAYLDLLPRFCPESQRGAVNADEVYVEFEYLPLEQKVNPYIRQTICTREGDDAITTVDLVLPLPYSEERRTVDTHTGQVVASESRFHHVPVLVLVQLNPQTIEPAIAEFNLIRHFINTDSATNIEVHELMDSQCLLVTKRPLMDVEKTLLESQNIHHLALDFEYEKYVLGLVFDPSGPWAYKGPYTPYTE